MRSAIAAPTAVPATHAPPNQATARATRERNSRGRTSQRSSPLNDATQAQWLCRQEKQMIVAAAE